MRNKNNYRKPLNHSRSEERDHVLMIILLIFNLGSGYTTIKGVEILLGIPSLAWLIGGFIQLALFLTLSEFMLKKAKLLKWIAIVIFSLCSVYTSFFTYYTNLAGTTNIQLAYDKAAQAHNKLVADVYTPMKNHLDKLEKDAATLNRKAEEEKRGGISPLKGEGPEYRKFNVEAIEKRTEAEQFKKTLDQLSAKFNYDLEGLDPRKIMERDREALASVPQEFRNNYKELNRSTYINTDDDISFFSPYLKLTSPDKNQSRPAFVSLVIAGLVDGMSILLGTGISIKRSQRPVIPTLIRSMRGYMREIRKAFTDHPHLPGNTDGPEAPDVVDMITFSLRGKGSQFLQDFYNAISSIQPHSIDSRVFLEHQEKTYQESFRYLTDILRDPQLGWISLNQNNYLVPEQHYHNLVNWLMIEIKRLGEEEQQQRGRFRHFKFRDQQDIPVSEVKLNRPTLQNANYN